MLARKKRIFYETLEKIVETLQEEISEHEECDEDCLTDYEKDEHEAMVQLIDCIETIIENN